MSRDQRAQQIVRVMQEAEDRREELGREVRDAWIHWALEQENPKPSWLTAWEDMNEPDREVDRIIGERLYVLGALNEVYRDADP